MRGTILTLMAVLVMTSFAFGQAPTLTVVADDYYVADGYKSFIVQAIGDQINTLGEFTITGDVYQVWTAAGVMSEWSALTATTPGNAMDSYVMFGNDRIPDLPIYDPWDVGETPPTPETTETIDTVLGTNEGLGTLNNVAPAGTPDSYFSDIEYTGEPIPSDPNLFHLVIPDGGYVVVTCDLTQYEGPDAVTTQDITVQVNCPLDGDADENGIVDLNDLDALGTNYNTLTGMTWANGDFTGDGGVDLNDLDALGTNYNQSASWYVPGEASTAPVPEPGTILMLVLGTLCLALRRK